MNRLLDVCEAEGEIGLTIGYDAGRSQALEILGGAMQMIASLDALDRALLSSVHTELEPVSILNDVQHSSLKILLKRWLRGAPDEMLASGDWKRWVGALLVKGKHKLLERMDDDAPAIAQTLESLRADYQRAPGLVGYEPPSVEKAVAALEEVRIARRLLAGSSVMFQSELGDIALPDVEPAPDGGDGAAVEHVVNRGREWLKVRFPDMLASAQWTVLRGGRQVRVTILHREWLDAYHRREISLLPGDAIDCDFEETVGYDAAQNEVERRLTIIRVHGVKSPPVQGALLS